MGKWIKIIVTLLSLALIVKVSDGDVFGHHAQAGGLQTAQITSGDSKGDYSTGEYTHWNVMEFASAQSEISAGRQSESGSRVRSSEAQTNIPYTQRASILKGGKLQSLQQALTFTFGTGLFPSGKYSFSQHLISLMKLRL